MLDIFTFIYIYIHIYTYKFRDMMIQSIRFMLLFVYTFFKTNVKFAVWFSDVAHCEMLLLLQHAINISHLLLVTSPRLVILEERVVGTILQLPVVKVLR